METTDGEPLPPLLDRLEALLERARTFDSIPQRFAVLAFGLEEIVADERYHEWCEDEALAHWRREEWETELAAEIEVAAEAPSRRDVMMQYLRGRR